MPMTQRQRLSPRMAAQRAAFRRLPTIRGLAMKSIPLGRRCSPSTCQRRASTQTSKAANSHGASCPSRRASRCGATAARSSAGCSYRMERRLTRAIWTTGPSPKAPRSGSNFPIAGVRIETRLLEKHGPTDADWLALAFVWDRDGQDATRRAARCHRCTTHRSRRASCRRMLRLSRGSAQFHPRALGLATCGRRNRGHARRTRPTRPNQSAPNQQPRHSRRARRSRRARLLACQLQPLPQPDTPRPVRRALFRSREGHTTSHSPSTSSTTGATPTYRTVVGHAVKSGDPDGSHLYELVSSRGMFRQMPPLATEHVDTIAIETLRAWIAGL